TNTQQYGKRPYGVGLLIAGVDAKGPTLFEFQPSGRNLDEFENSSREELIKHALRSLKDSLAQDKGA
ncbi:hypothetical protein BTJ68_12363, partial [Hortaea werneckii EXF-2000]